MSGRYWKVGLAAAGGGVLLFLSGGVAAPSVTASLSAVGYVLYVRGPDNSVRVCGVLSAPLFRGLGVFQCSARVLGVDLVGTFCGNF